MTRGRSLERLFSICLVVVLALPVGASASTSKENAAQAPLTSQQDGQNTTTSVVDKEAGAQAPASKDPAPPEQKPTPAEGTQPPARNSTPLGTAAAPDTRPDGVPASTPSGAAIAPSKQRRVRRFSIRTALVVGAVVAIGVVAGLSLSSSGRQ